MSSASELKRSLFPSTSSDTALFIFELPGMSLDGLEVDGETITIETHVEAASAVCPICQTMAQRVHSHYGRTLHDVLCGTKALRLVVQVRRFFCDNKDCPRKIFGEAIKFVKPPLTSTVMEKRLSPHWAAFQVNAA